jgi:NADPH2:quinone reductase
VLAVGEGVTEFAAGDRVLGLGGGAFAEKAVAPAAACAQMPQNFSFEEAAGFLISYCTALYGLRDCGALETGETLLVLGAAGGVGMAAIDVAKIMGATVIAAASTAEKLESCRAQGADMTIDYTIEGWRNQVKELTAGHGVNMVYDPVGGEFSELAFRSLAPKGRHLVIGFAAGGIPRIPLNLPLLKRSSIVGVDWGGYMRDDPNNNKPLLEQLMIWAKDGKLHPVANARYALDDAAIAMRDLLDRKVMGKAIIIP